MVTYHLGSEMAREAIVPSPSPTEKHPAALYFSDMRRLMAKHTSGRVVMGGSAEPRARPGGPGYGGRYPGVAEEAWRTLESRKPLYAAGGFGGVAALVVDMLEGKGIPQELYDHTWRDNLYFQETMRAIDACYFREKLGLPQRMEDLAQALIDAGRPLLNDDDVSIRWNGLTVQENWTVFRTRDPLLLTALILKGLQAVAHASK